MEWSSLQIQEPIGSGSFGIVYHALWHQTPVAVKTFKNNDTNAPPPLEGSRPGYTLWDQTLIKLEEVSWVGREVGPWQRSPLACKAHSSNVILTVHALTRV